MCSHPRTPQLEICRLLAGHVLSKVSPPSPSRLSLLLQAAAAAKVFTLFPCNSLWSPQGRFSQRRGCCLPWRTPRPTLPKLSSAGSVLFVVWIHSARAGALPTLYPAGRRRPPEAKQSRFWASINRDGCGSMLLMAHWSISRGRVSPNGCSRRVATFKLWLHLLEGVVRLGGGVQAGVQGVIGVTAAVCILHYAFCMCVLVCVCVCVGRRGRWLFQRGVECRWRGAYRLGQDCTCRAGNLGSPSSMSRPV